MTDAKGLFKIKNFELSFETKRFCDIHDMTPEASGLAGESGVENGQAHFFVVGSTAGITTVEYEPGLLKDIAAFFEKNGLPGMPITITRKPGMTAMASLT